MKAVKGHAMKTERVESVQQIPHGTGKSVNVRKRISIGTAKSA